MLALDNAFLPVGLMTAGCGLIFLRLDRANATSRPLAYSLLALGVRLLLTGYDGNFRTQSGIAVGMAAQFLEAVGIFFGIEWGKRVSCSGTGAHWSIRTLFIASQVLVLVFMGLQMGYLLVAPELAMSDREGTIQVSGLEWAIFAPVLGTALLLAGIAIVVALVTRVDRAERIRLRALLIAAPFLLIALIMEDRYVPVLMTIGLLIYLAGSIRFLVVQSQRGEFMSRFLSPEVAELVRVQGIQTTLSRERRVLSVVFCDLRGFTRFARTQNSDLVMNVLEKYYRVVGDIAAQYGGTIKDHAGDGVLILVGAPIPQPDHASRAARLALDLAEQGSALLQEEAPELGIGVGIATGNTTVGTLKGAGRLEYVAVGNPVNLAARLSDRAAAGEVLADIRTADALHEEMSIHQEMREPEPLKGFPEPIPVCALQRSLPSPV